MAGRVLNRDSFDDLLPVATRSSRAEVAECWSDQPPSADSEQWTAVNRR